METGDWVCIVNLEYKPGTRDKYMCFSVVKRRRVDQGDKEESKILYVAHPFAPNNGLRLLDDIDSMKVLSLNSLATDIQGMGKEQTNAVPRKRVERKEFEE